MRYEVRAKKLYETSFGKCDKNIDFKALVERFFKQLGLVVELEHVATRVLRNKIVVKGRVRFRDSSTMFLQTYFYIEQLVNGLVNGNIVATYIQHTSICGRRAFITGKKHYLLFTTRKYIYLVEMNIITNIITECDPLYDLLYMETIPAKKTLRQPQEKK